MPTRRGWGPAPRRLHLWDYLGRTSGFFSCGGPLREAMNLRGSAGCGGVNPAVSMAPGAWGRNAPRKLWRNNCAAGPARLEKAGGKRGQEGGGSRLDGGGAVTCARGGGAPKPPRSGTLSHLEAPCQARTFLHDRGTELA